MTASPFPDASLLSDLWPLLRHYRPQDVDRLLGEGVLRLPQSLLAEGLSEVVEQMPESGRLKISRAALDVLDHDFLIGVEGAVKVLGRRPFTLQMRFEVASAKLSSQQKTLVLRCTQFDASGIPLPDRVTAHLLTRLMHSFADTIYQETGIRLRIEGDLITLDLADFLPLRQFDAHLGTPVDALLSVESVACRRGAFDVQLRFERYGLASVLTGARQGPS